MNIDQVNNITQFDHIKNKQEIEYVVYKKKELNELVKSIDRMTLNTKGVLTLEEAAIYSGYSQSHLRKLNKEGIVRFSSPSFKKMFIDRKQLENDLTKYSIRLDSISSLVSAI